MNAGTKSLIRHILTALGVLLAALGMADAAELVNGMLADMDKVWDAVLVLVGFATSVLAFFTNKERFTEGNEEAEG
jgi:hypothetical protein